MLLERTVGQISDRVRVLGNRMWLVGQPGYEDHSGGYGRGDLAAAAARLEQAGWAEGAGGVRVKNGRKLLLRYSTTQGIRGRVQAGELLQDQLAKVGIDLEILAVDDLFERLPENAFDIAAFAWVGGPAAVSGSRDTYVTGTGLNYGRFSDPEVDALFEQAIAELDPDRSTALANQIDRKLWEELPSIPLYQRPTFLAWRGTLRNVTENATTEAATDCDVFLAVGTSLTVHPAAGLTDLAAQSGARVVVVNAEPTPYDRLADPKPGA